MSVRCVYSSIIAIGWGRQNNRVYVIVKIISLVILITYMYILIFNSDCVCDWSYMQFWIKLEYKSKLNKKYRWKLKHYHKIQPNNLGLSL